MSYFRFSFRFKVCYAFVIAMTICSTVVQGAEWRECEKAKLRELKMRRGADDHKTSKHQKRRSEGRQRAEEIDTWLWKNCREFSYELRQLEQDKM
jgi:hypothetical protein